MTGDWTNWQTRLVQVQQLYQHRQPSILEFPFLAVTVNLSISSLLYEFLKNSTRSTREWKRKKMTMGRRMRWMTIQGAHEMSWMLLTVESRMLE